MEDILFIPVDISVTPTPGLYFSRDKFDFGYGTSLQEPSKLTLEIFNSARRVIKVNVSLTTCFHEISLDVGFLLILN